MLPNQFHDSFKTPKFIRFPKYGLDYSLQNVRLLYISITSEIGFGLITSPHRHCLQLRSILIQTFGIYVSPLGIFLPSKINQH